MDDAGRHILTHHVMCRGIVLSDEPNMQIHFIEKNVCHSANIFFEIMNRDKYFGKANRISIY